MADFVDSHAHIYFKEYGEETDGVIERAGSAGIRAIVCPGTGLETATEAVGMAAKHSIVYAAVGIHPHEASSATDSVLGTIRDLHSTRKVVAIGEIGLDYHYNFSPPEVQRTAFATQISLAQECRLPIIIHSREAWEDTLRIVEEAVVDTLRVVEEAVVKYPSWGGRPGADGPARGVFHCFPGDEEMARKVIELGFYISFPGPLTFPEKPARPNLMAAVAAAVPLERILLETDSPYLTPHPYRGRRNEPSNVPFIAAKLAAIRGISIDEVAQTTTQNSVDLFGLDIG
jgi:TatD DNase family protein